MKSVFGNNEPLIMTADGPVEAGTIVYVYQSTGKIDRFEIASYCLGSDFIRRRAALTPKKAVEVGKVFCRTIMGRRKADLTLVRYLKEHRNA